MSRRPEVITLAQLADAARAAAVVAAEERTVTLTDAEAREVSGGGYPTIDPTLSGFFPTVSSY